MLIQLLRIGFCLLIMIITWVHTGSAAQAAFSKPTELQIHLGNAGLRPRPSPISAQPTV
jgi:hypothetical protein